MKRPTTERIEANVGKRKSPDYQYFFFFFSAFLTLYLTIPTFNHYDKPLYFAIFSPGVPDSPQGPLKVSDITKSSCHLAWKPPVQDGGQKILGYLVERQEVGKPYWTTVASRCKVSFNF